MDITPRDLHVWTSYLGTAIALPVIQEDTELTEELIAATASLEAGSTAGVISAVEHALEVAQPDPLDHPVKQGAVRVARINLQYLLNHVEGGSDKAAAENAVTPNEDDQEPSEPEETFAKVQSTPAEVYDAMTVKELKDALKARGIKPSGRKPALVEALVASDATPVDTSELGTTVDSE